MPPQRKRSLLRSQEADVASPESLAPQRLRRITEPLVQPPEMPPDEPGEAPVFRSTGQTFPPFAGVKRPPPILSQQTTPIIPPTVPADEVIIDVVGVERSFMMNRREVRALRGVTMQIARGSFVVMMGPSGSGKTTLINILGALDKPTKGAIIMDGIRLDRRSSGQLTDMRRRIGFIFQSFALMPTASAYENVELGLRISRTVPRKFWDTRIRRCLGAVGLTPWMHHRPYELSGGQQQRVAIARALAIEPSILLADEPTGDLDSKTGEQVLRLLRALVDHLKMTLITATHDPAAAAFATDVFQLRDGQIVNYEKRR